MVQFNKSNSLHTYVMVSDIGTHEWPLTTYTAFIYPALCMIPHCRKWKFLLFRIKKIYYCFITDMIRAKKTHCKYISIEGKTHFHIKKNMAHR